VNTKATPRGQSRRDARPARQYACLLVPLVLCTSAMAGTRVPDITLGYELPERRDPLAVLFREELSFKDCLDILKRAESDPEVPAVLLRVQPLLVGTARVQEVRAAIAAFRKSGKKAYSYIETGTTTTYLVASSCDQVYIAPTGVLQLTGGRIEVTFYKGLFDKLGIRADLIQVGEAKGAEEPFTRTEMSEPFKATLQGLLEEIYSEVTTAISTSRSLSKEETAKRIDRGLFSARDAKAARLVDELAYSSELQALLAKQLGLAVRLDPKYSKSGTDLTRYVDNPLRLFSDIFSKIKQSEIAGETPVIALVYVVGPIVPGRPNAIGLGNLAVSTEIVQALEEAAGDPKVRAIILRVESPGGAVVAGDQIRKAVEDAAKRKPVVASFSDLAASAGYEIAVNATAIVASESSIVGSIGVIGGKVVLKGLYDKIGVTKQSLSRGANANIFSDYGEFTPQERAAFTRLCQEYYEDFVQKVAAGRKLTPADADRCAHGRLWSGRQAKKLGLVDELGGLDRAISIAKEKAKLAAAAPVTLRAYPAPRGLAGFLEGLASSFSPLDPYRDAVILHTVFQYGPAYILPYSIEVR